MTENMTLRGRDRVDHDDSFHSHRGDRMPVPITPDATGSAPQARPARASPRSGANDFDFLSGDWRVRHRRLRERLAGNDDWVEFEGTCAMRALIGGLGNVDDNVMDMPTGRIAASRCAPTMPPPASGRSGGWMRASRTSSTRPSSAASMPASARFTPTRPSGAARSASATAGATPSRCLRPGTRRSRRMPAKRGKPTGRCDSREWT